MIFAEGQRSAWGNIKIFTSLSPLYRSKTFFKSSKYSIPVHSLTTENFQGITSLTFAFGLGLQRPTLLLIIVYTLWSCGEHVCQVSHRSSELINRTNSFGFGMKHLRWYEVLMWFTSLKYFTLTYSFRLHKTLFNKANNNETPNQFFTHIALKMYIFLSLSGFVCIKTGVYYPMDRKQQGVQKVVGVMYCIYCVRYVGFTGAWAWR